MSSIADGIHAFLDGLGPDGVIWCVLAAIAGLCILGFWEKFRRSVPLLMVCAGILGTLCGLFLAAYPELKELADKSADADVRNLLHGVVIGLVASMLGIGAAAVYHLFVPTQPSGAGDLREVLPKLDELLRGYHGTLKQLEAIALEMQNVVRPADLKGFSADVRDLVVWGVTDEVMPLLKKIKEELEAGEPQPPGSNEKLMRMFMELMDRLDGIRTGATQTADAVKEVLRRIEDIQPPNGNAEVLELLKAIEESIDPDEILYEIRELQAACAKEGDLGYHIKEALTVIGNSLKRLWAKLVDAFQPAPGPSNRPGKATKPPPAPRPSNRPDEPTNSPPVREPDDER